MKRSGFTLIELLIVVAIIAILAAIAVPNFLEAQTRSKVARSKADLRTISIALQSYCVDHNNFPPDKVPNGAGTYDGNFGLLFEYFLTTPVAYLTHVDFKDPFGSMFMYRKAGGPEWVGSYMYTTYQGWGGQYLKSQNPVEGPIWAKRKGAVICGFGPMKIKWWWEWVPYFYNHPNEIPYWNGQYNFYIGTSKPAWPNFIYDPTNGTVSNGGVGRAVGDLSCPDTIG